MRLKDKVAIVTGGAMGIGRAVCELFAKEGAKVVVADIENDGGNETVSLIEKNNGQAVFVEADVSQEQNAKKITDTAVKAFGKIDVLINNAAEFILKGMEDVTPDDWAKCMGVNVHGPSYCIKYAVPEMKKAGSGSIVNVGSVAGIMALPGHMPYAPSKGAVIAMTRNLAQELGPFNIRVNCLSPGGTLTPAVYRAMKMWDLTLEQVTENINKQTFLNRMAQPVEIASAALFLASDEASYVTGVNLVADGGWSV